MEIIERKENPILNRIELTWQWRHTGEATPTRAQIIAAVVKIEPGATKDCVVVKSVNTRFGQPLTTGNALVYGDRSDLEKEPKYILERHGGAEEAPVEEAPVEAPAEDAEAAEIAGGEE
jgi:small subunit ribosomal protein S24e